MSYSRATTAQRAAKREAAMALLRAKRVRFTVTLSGGQLVVHYPGGSLDFWPATGRWRVRATGMHMFKTERGGIESVLQYVAQQEIQL